MHVGERGAFEVLLFGHCFQAGGPVLEVVAVVHVDRIAADHPTGGFADLHPFIGTLLDPFEILGGETFDDFLRCCQLGAHELFAGGLLRS